MTDHQLPWCNPILTSDLPAFTRLVLMTVAVFENDPQRPGSPTMKQLCDATKLRERTVRKHINIARKAGWEVSFSVGGGVSR